MKDKIFNGLSGRIKFSEPLSGHTTFRIGGKARYFIKPKNIKELKLLLSQAKTHKIPVRVIGSGSNILVSDQGIKAVVLHLSSPYFNKASFGSKRVEVGAGYPLRKLVSLAGRCGLSGIEALAGIPGTVGGALAMNAGQGHGGISISDSVESLTLMDYNGRIKKIGKRDIKFVYRSSGLSEYIILKAALRLTKRNKGETMLNISRCLEYRRSKHDLSGPSAGCIFKNPKGQAAAGRLIDLCGLKGKKIGGAFISKRHANFILNTGHAKARDVLRLMKITEKKVKDKFNVSLEPEIKIWR